MISLLAQKKYTMALLTSLLIIEYKWLNYATQVIKDRNRYEIIANHYGLTIERAVKGELIFKELKDEN